MTYQGESSMNVKVVTTVNGNLIVNVKEARVAISKEMAQRIMI